MPSHHIDPDNDPSEAYELHPADWREGWWTATCNGVPVHHFHDEAKGRRYVSDPAYRLSLVTRFIHG